MSAARDELTRLVRELPDDQVPAALEALRRHLRWPPRWFGIAPGDGTPVGARSEELLDDWADRGENG